MIFLNPGGNNDCILHGWGYTRSFILHDPPSRHTYPAGAPYSAFPPGGRFFPPNSPPMAGISGWARMVGCTHFFFWKHPKLGMMFFQASWLGCQIGGSLVRCSFSEQKLGSFFKSCQSLPNHRVDELICCVYFEMLLKFWRGTASTLFIQILVFVFQGMFFFLSCRSQWEMHRHVQITNHHLGKFNRFFQVFQFAPQGFEKHKKAAQKPSFLLLKIKVEMKTERMDPKSHVLPKILVDLSETAVQRWIFGNHTNISTKEPKLHHVLNHGCFASDFVQHISPARCLVGTKIGRNDHQDFMVVGKACRSQKHPLSHVSGHKTGGVFHQAYWQKIIHQAFKQMK